MYALLHLLVVRLIVKPIALCARMYVTVKGRISLYKFHEMKRMRAYGAITGAYDNLDK